MHSTSLLLRKYSRENVEETKGRGRGGQSPFLTVLGSFLPWPFVYCGGGDIRYMRGPRWVRFTQRFGEGGGLPGTVGVAPSVDHVLFCESSGMAWTTFLVSRVGTVILTACDQTP